MANAQPAVPQRVVWMRNTQTHKALRNAHNLPQRANAQCSGCRSGCDVADPGASCGKTDDYKTHDNAATTSAMGEGAIEGVAADYEMASKFATHFKYSRYGLTEAKPRDISKLAGEKKRLSGNADVGAA
jgi:hypothetical protein